ncbi:MAG: acyl-[Bacteroidales bacterium]|nr:acyl-[acyl-carrier-protein]--UDP-N-acetylglucosamine O-acyltransferase [Bacteroidales bacterium]
GEIKEIYRMIYQGGMTVSDACIAIKGAFPRSTHRDMILSFVENSGRGIIKCPVK